MWILVWIVLIKVFLVQGQDDCLLNKTAVRLENRNCLTPCETKADCRNKRASCSCDGACGLSCIAPGTKCSKPPDIENGEMTLPKSLIFGSKITYKCNDGYELIGSTELTCNGERYFGGKIPICVLAGQRCPTPPFEVPKGYSEISPKRNEFFIGEKVTYTCQIGYVRKPVDISTTECVLNEETNSAEWKPAIKMTCSAKRCRSLPAVANAVEEIATGFFGDIFTYQCKPGYRLRGNSRRQCMDNNQWSGSTPTCEALTCEELTSPENGKVFYNSLTYGSSALFECERGFYLEGTEYLTCTVDGIWSHEEPQCIKIDCGDPPKPQDGSIIEVTSTELDGRVTYQCNKNTKGLSSVMFAECKSDRKWSSPPPICMRNCLIPYNFNGMLHRPQSNGRYSAYNKIPEGRYMDHGTGLVLSCNSGHEILPENFYSEPINQIEDIKCDNGTLLSFQKCVPARCPCEELLSKTKRLKLHPKDCTEYAMHGSEIDLQCDHTYPEFHGPSSVAKCSFGKWSIPNSQCTLESCNLKDYFEFENGYKTLYEDGRQVRDKTRYSKIKHDGEIHFTCYTGYEMQIDNEILASPYLTVKCQRGQWDRNIPACRPARCPCNKLRQDIEKRKLITEDCTNYATHNSQVNLECHQEFPEFHGIEDAAKCSFGVWDIPNSKCTYESCGLEDFYSLENGSVKLYEDGYEARGKNKYGKIKHGGEAVYSCDKKFELYLGNDVQESSTLEMICQKGEWEKPPPTCKPARCSCVRGLDSLQINNIEIADECPHFVSDESVLSLRCKDEYPEFRGTQKTINCVSGTWIIPDSYCTKVSCQVDEGFELKNGKVQVQDGDQKDQRIPTIMKHGSKLAYSCNNGYVLYFRGTQYRRNSFARICNNGEWSDDHPVCKEVQIPEEPTSESHLQNCILGKASNGIFRRVTDNNLLETGAVIKNEEIVKFECNEGFKIHPGITSDEIQCRNGKFQPENLSCSPKTSPSSTSNQLTTISTTESTTINITKRIEISDIPPQVSSTETPTDKNSQEPSQVPVTEKTELSPETNIFEPKSEEDWSYVTEKQEIENTEITEKNPGGNCSFEVIANVLAFHNDIEIQRNGKYSSGSQLTFRCKDIGKFHFSGKTILQCLNERWNEEMPKCTELNLRDRHSAPVLDYEVESETFDIEPNGTLVIDAGDTLTLGCHWFSFYGEPKWIVSQTTEEQREPPGEWNEERTIYQLIKTNVTEENSGIYQCMNPRTKATNSINVRVIKKIIPTTTTIATTTITTTSKIISQWTTPKDNSDFKKNQPHVPKINPSFGSFCTFYPGQKNIIAFYEGKPIAAGSQIEENSEITVRCSNINSLATTGVNKVTCKNSYWSPRLPTCYHLYKNSEFSAPPINFESSSYEILEDGTVLLHSSPLSVYCLYARANYQSRPEIVYQKPKLTTAGGGCPLYSDLIFDNIQKAYYQIYDVSTSTTFEVQCVHPFKPQLKHKIVFTTSNNLRLRRTEENCQKCLFYTNDNNLQAYYQGQQISNLTQVENEAIVSFICSNISFHLLRGEKKLRCDKGRWSNLIPTCERLISGDGNGAPPITFSRQDFQVDEDGIVILTPSLYSLSVFCERRKYNQNTGKFEYPIFDVTKGNPHRSVVFVNIYPYIVFDVRHVINFEVTCSHSYQTSFHYLTVENSLTFKITHTCSGDGLEILPNTRKKVYVLGDSVQIKCPNSQNFGILQCKIDIQNQVSWHWTNSVC